MGETTLALLGLGAIALFLFLSIPRRGKRRRQGGQGDVPTGSWTFGDGGADGGGGDGGGGD
ncbi:hypothetical protein HKCCE2091_01895 [Rhodobacterales bacterium HKCCE2091]|nr:hypothetical protein [Rhodobacterales bacterium HKCCE2091]